MNAEAATYAHELAWVLQEVGVSLTGLTAAQLNWRPPGGTANSAYVIASHVLSVTRVYVLGFGCAQPVTRDRPAEFAARGDDAKALLAGLERLTADSAAALGRLTPQDLDRRFVPPRELWGIGDITEISARDALVHAIRHAGIHLGELRLTRDLALAAG